MPSSLTNQRSVILPSMLLTFKLLIIVLTGVIMSNPQCCQHAQIRVLCTEEEEAKHRFKAITYGKRNVVLVTRSHEFLSLWYRLSYRTDLSILAAKGKISPDENNMTALYAAIRLPCTLESFW